MSAATAGQMAVVKATVHALLAPILIAAFLSAFLGGIVVSLAVTYFTRFPNDKLVFKVFVGGLTVAAVVDTICECAWPYHSVTTYFMDPASLALWPWISPLPPWLLLTAADINFLLYEYTEYLFLTTAVVAMCQAFFIWRVWIVSGHTSYVLTGIQVLIALAGDACCLYLGIWSLSQTSLAAFSEVVEITYSWLACWAGVDVLITASMVYFLAVRPKKMHGSDVIHQSPLLRLVYLAFETNGVAMALQILTLGLVNYSLGAGNIWYTIPGFLEGKVYIACVLVTLNARNSTATDATLSHSETTRSKGLGARNFSRNPNSVQVHITQDVDVDEHPVGYGSSTDASSPYALKFDSVREDDSSEMEKGRGMY